MRFRRKSMKNIFIHIQKEREKENKRLRTLETKQKHILQLMDGDISGWSKDLLFFHADSREENLDIKIEVEEVINVSKKISSRHCSFYF